MLLLERQATLVATLDEEGIGAAYAAHGQELYRYARRALADEGEAQDAVQETFLRAWRAADLFDPARASVRGWLFAILRNVVIDHARSRSARMRVWIPVDRSALEVAAGAGPDPTERLLHTEVLRKGLRRLGANHRSALVETYLRDRPYAEVAAEQGILVGTLRSRVFHALRSLRQELDEMG